MKYSKWIGIFSCGILIISCFLPWVELGPIQHVITGMNTAGTNFGKPGLLNIFFATIALVLFLIPARWAKRSNIFTCTINFSWTLRNLLIIPACQGIDCPVQRIGLYLTLIASVLMMVVAFTPPKPTWSY